MLLHVDVQPGWGSQLEHEQDAQVSITRERTRRRSRPCWTSTRAPEARGDVDRLLTRTEPDAADGDRRDLAAVVHDLGIGADPQDRAAVREERLGCVGGVEDVGLPDLDAEREVAEGRIEPHAALGLRRTDVPAERSGARSLTSLEQPAEDRMRFEPTLGTCT